ncbi:MAG: hypothetical protein AAF618_09715, partial [Pseudomonadota bacterium]
MLRSIAACLLVFASTLAAQALDDTSRPMTPAEFEAYTTGKTFFFATEGNQPYGAEEYLPNRQVRWAFT